MRYLALPEDDVASLVGRAHARVRFPDLDLSDPLAEDLLEKLEVEHQRFGAATLRGAALAAKTMDVPVRGFFERHPDGLAVALYPGLCTRFSRVDNGRLRWIDLDPPGVVEVKCALYTTPDRHIVTPCSALVSDSWMQGLREAVGVPVLLISQGSLRRVSCGELDRFLTRASQWWPRGTEVLLEYDHRRPLRRSSPETEKACLEVPMCSGHTARYPRFRFVTMTEYGQEQGGRLDGTPGLLRPQVAHLRLS